MLNEVFERIFLVINLINNFLDALTLFGAVKRATGLPRDDEQNKKTNLFKITFYLLGILFQL